MKRMQKKNILVKEKIRRSVSEDGEPEDESG
jgi:hypothetical protein